MTVNLEPYEQLTGPVEIYVAPYVSGTGGETPPDVDDVPAGNWVLLGRTDGDQMISQPEEIEDLFDNSSPAPVKPHRTKEEKKGKFTLVDMTLEMLKYALGTTASVTSAAGPPAVKKLVSKRGFGVAQYSLLMRGEFHSPYGDFPGQDYTPRVVFTSSVEKTHGKKRVEVEVEWRAYEDPNQVAGEELGYAIVQTA